MTKAKKQCENITTENFENFKNLAKNLIRVPKNEIERQMAVGTIRDWIRIYESKTGRPRKWKSIKEKNDFYSTEKKKKRKANREEI